MYSKQIYFGPYRNVRNTNGFEEYMKHQASNSNYLTHKKKCISTLRISFHHSVRAECKLVARTTEHWSSSVLALEPKVLNNDTIHNNNKNYAHIALYWYLVSVWIFITCVYLLLFDFCTHILLCFGSHRLSLQSYCLYWCMCVDGICVQALCMCNAFTNRHFVRVRKGKLV